METEEDRETDEPDRKRRGVLADGEPGNNVGRMTSLRGLGNFTDRPVTHRGVVIGDYEHDAGHDQANERSKIKIVRAPRDALDSDAIREKRMRRRPEEN